jgi:NAD(P)-dependent dehydrogenase (short-subunit alcohol dehydrogenase family)
MFHMAIITVGSRGIGIATTRLAAEASSDVYLNYVLVAEAAQKLAIECQSKGRRVGAVQTDITDSTDIAGLFHACDRRLGPLVDNADIIGQTTTVANLVYGTVYCPREAIKRLAKSAGGSGAAVLNNFSVAAGNPGRPAAVTTNALLRQLATPEDITNGIMWLVSAPADYVNGAVLPVSDGL